MTTETLITIDYRERDLIKLLNETQLFKFTAKNLDVGDIQIASLRSLLIIERKTVNDYLASIKTKRLYEQLMRLKKLRQDHPTVKLVLILEGDMQASWGSTHVISPDVDMVYMSLIRRCFNDDITVIRSESLRQTATWLGKLVTYMSTLKLHEVGKGFVPCQLPSHNPYLDVISLKKKSNLTTKVCFVSQLAQIPGVSVKMAECVASVYPSMLTLANAYAGCTDKENLLSGIVVGGRRLGPVVSSRVYHYLNGDTGDPCLNVEISAPTTDRFVSAVDVTKVLIKLRFKSH